MPQKKNGAKGQAETSKVERAKRYLSGVGIERNDSDDELGTEDLPWEWIYSEEYKRQKEAEAAEEEEALIDLLNTEAASTPSARASRKRKVATRSQNPVSPQIIGARMGNFECKVGDTVLLKADGTNEAWVGLICDFVEEDVDGDMAANFMWFATEKEIRNKSKKRTDFLQVSEDWHEDKYTADAHKWRRMNSIFLLRGTSILWLQSMAKLAYCLTIPS